MRHFGRSISADVIIGLILVALQQPSSHAAQSERIIGTVSGRVTLDGQPVFRARVILSPDAMTARRSSDVDTITAMTNEEGTFRLTGVQPGGFLVSVVASVGFLIPDPDQSSVRVVVVHEAEQLALDLPLARGGVITGRIMLGDGSPLIGQVVLATPARSESRPEVPVRIPRPMAQTDDRGIYRIFSLPAGRYLISVLPGGSNRRLNQIYHPGVADPNKAVAITVVPPSEVENVDIKLDETSNTYSISGHVMDGEGGKPATGISVSYINLSGDRRRSFEGKTTSSGEFVLHDVIPGRYQVFVRNDGNDDRISERLDFEVIDKDIAGLSLVLRRDSSDVTYIPSSPRAETTDSNQSSGVTRDLTLGSITGVVVTDSGRPVTNVSVGATSIKTEIFYVGNTLDAKGRFRIDNLPEGEYRLFVDSPGYRFPRGSGGGLVGVFKSGESVRLVMSKAGVITGRVLDAGGDPVVGLIVRAITLSGPEGNRQPTIGGAGRTDDRGIYRIYTLVAGAYLLSAGGSSQDASGINGYQNDAPTFFPSTDREGASEVKVGLAEEVTGIDILYRHEKGYTVRGTIVGPVGVNGVFTSQLVLMRSSGEAVVSEATVRIDGQEASFRLRGISDGEYELVARAGFTGSSAEALATVHVKVANADVTGLRIQLRLLSSITGIIEVQRGKMPGSLACQPGSPLLQRDVSVSASQEVATQPDRRPMPSVPTEATCQVDEAWRFTLMNISEGVYRPRMRLNNPNWYVTSVRMVRPLMGATVRPSERGSADVMLSGIPIGVGENVSGLVVTVSSGASGVSGQVVGRDPNPFPGRMVVTLVPAERDAGNDVLRYRHIVATEEGSFSVANLAPGRYWLLAKPLEGDPGVNVEFRPSYWNSAVRAHLRQEAAKGQRVFELQSCQKLDGVVIECDAR